MEAEGEVYKPSSVKDLKRSGAWKLLVYSMALFTLGYVAYELKGIGIDLLIGLLAIALALAIGAGVELRFWQLKMQIRNLERMIQKLSASAGQS